MDFAWLKRFMPRGLYGRALLILIVPVVTMQLVVSMAFIQRHFEGVTEQLTDGVVLDLSAVTRLLESDPAGGGPDAALSLARQLQLALAPVATPVTGDTRAFYDLSGRVMIDTIRAAIPGITGIDLSDSRSVVVGLRTPRGPMNVTFDRRRISASNPHQLLVLMALTGLFMTLISYLFLRNQLRPIRRLAHAAEAFGRGREIDYKPSGAVEVRAAGNAFLDMRARIERQIETRTLMLSGVSHDLRTPLTRLKLGLGMLDDSADVAAMQRDVDEMQGLLDAFLAFARGDAQDDPTEEADPVIIAAQSVDAAVRSGQNVVLREASGHSLIKLRAIAVRRALDNLIGNAVRYGRRAEVSVTLLEKSVRFTVEDDGPGIPRGRREEALRPFARLDASRNQDRGAGVGLGLSIVADVARSHGGSLRLGDSDALGGLRADLILPR